MLPPKWRSFNTVILAESLSHGVKIDNLPKYDVMGNPYDHIDKFYANADIYDINDIAYCKTFRTTVYWAKCIKNNT